MRTSKPAVNPSRRPKTPPAKARGQKTMVFPTSTIIPSNRGRKESIVARFPTQLTRLVSEARTLSADAQTLIDRTVVYIRGASYRQPRLYPQAIRLRIPGTPDGALAHKGMSYEEIGKRLGRKETTVRLEIAAGLREVETRLGKNFLTLIATDTPDSLAAAARTLDRAVSRDTGTGSLEDYFDSEFIAQLKATTDGATPTSSPDIEMLQQIRAYIMQFSKVRIHDELHALDAPTLAYVAARITGTGGNSNDQYMFAQKLRNEASK